MQSDNRKCMKKYEMLENTVYEKAHPLEYHAVLKSHSDIWFYKMSA